VEIIVVDDASKDGSVEVASSFGSAVQVVRNTANQGAAVARNAGLDLAQGDWIALLDADDLWSRDKLEKQVRALDGATEDVVGVITSSYWFTESGERWLVHPQISDLEGPYHVNLLCRCLAEPSSALVRTDVARAVRFPVGVRNVEDVQFYLKLRRQGSILCVSEPLTYYRRSQGQLSGGPDHVVKSIHANMAFLHEHREWYTSEEFDTVRLRFADYLVNAHEIAVWRRDNAVARACRLLYYQVHPCPSNSPRLFKKWLVPWWIARVKDHFDSICLSSPKG
jgi:glycosyltransferase involved in cell wall biosynthesis